MIREDLSHYGDDDVKALTNHFAQLLSDEEKECILGEWLDLKLLLSDQRTVKPPQPYASILISKSVAESLQDLIAPYFHRTKAMVLENKKTLSQPSAIGYSAVKGEKTLYLLEETQSVQGLEGATKATVAGGASAESEERLEDDDILPPLSEL